MEVLIDVSGRHTANADAATDTNNDAATATDAATNQSGRQSVTYAIETAGHAGR